MELLSSSVARRNRRVAVRTLRLAVGSLITGLQTMPSIAWFPFAIVVFGGIEQAIYFVVVLGAAPSIANGIIAGIDHVPPTFVRLGKVMGATASVCTATSSCRRHCRRMSRGSAKDGRSPGAA